MKKILFPAIACLLIVFTSSCKQDRGKPYKHVSYPDAYVVNSKDNSISIIDLTDYTIKDKIDLDGSFPYHIYISPNKKWLAVSVTNCDLSNGFPSNNYNNYNSGNKIIIINAVTKEIVKEISLPRLASNGIFGINNSELWIGQADDLHSSILIYRTADWTLTNTITIGKGVGEVTFCSDGDMSFSCTSGDDSVQMNDFVDKSSLMDTTALSHPIGAWASSYHSQFIVCDGNNRIYELNASTCHPLDSIFLSFKPAHLAYISRGGELWVSDVTNGKIVWFSKTGTHWSQQGTIPVGNNPRWVQPDIVAGKVYIANQNSNTISVIDINSHNVIKTITVGNSPGGIAINR